MNFLKIDNKFFIINGKQKLILRTNSKILKISCKNCYENEFTLEFLYTNFNIIDEIISVPKPVFKIKNYVDNNKQDIILHYDLQYFEKLLYLKSVKYKKCSLCLNLQKSRLKICNCKKINPIIYMCKTNDYIFYENNYYRVSKIRITHSDNKKRDFNDMVKISKIIKKKIYQKNIYKDNVTICYDFETMNINGIHKPYILSWKLFTNNFFTQNFYEETECIWSDPYAINLKSIGEIFINKLVNDNDCVFNRLNNDFDDEFYNYKFIGNNNFNCSTITLFGFNNYRFDDNFILDYLVKSNFSVKKSERNGRCSDIICTFRNFKIIIKDLSKWVPDMSLKQACDDYNTSIKKLDIDIVKYNDICNLNKKLIYLFPIEENGDVWKDFNSILKNPLTFIEKRTFMKSEFYCDNKIKIFEYIKYYCKKDVESTLSLYEKINEAFINIYKDFNLKYDIKLSSLNILNYISPAFVMSLIYKQIFNKKNIKVIHFKNKKFLEFICDSYFGGKVDFGQIGHYESKNVNDITYMDVSSMYPTVMTSPLPIIYDENDINFGFSIKEWQEEINNTIELRNKAFENKELFNYKWLEGFNKKKAILLCNLYSPEENDLIPIAPFPERGFDKLVYNFENKYNVSVNTSDMKNLILCGFKIEVLNSPFNIEFLRNEKYFKELLDVLDEFKSNAKNNGNKAEAKLIKLLSNSISGKLGQKILSRISNYNNYNSSEYDEESITSSLHYIATFITGESRFILYRTIYNLYENCLYQRLPKYKRLGIFILCDTDSIVFDKSNAANIQFIVKDDYGYWCDEINDYIVHWKQKHSNDRVKSIFCLGRKSYVVCNDQNKIIKRVLKGIHSDLMEIISFDDFKAICDNKPKIMQKRGLIRKTLHLDGNKLLFKEIFEENIKKSLKLNYLRCVILNDLDKFKLENSELYEQCKQNLEKHFYKENINNFLAFVWNKK